jgi:hypothetical protein
MDLEKRKFDIWYAVNNTEILHAPSRALETFGATLVKYHIIAELDDVPGKVRIREGRMEAHKPAIITPQQYADEAMEGFGEEARKYFEYLKQNQDSIRILQYGYTLKQEAFSEQVVTDSVEAVTERVVQSVKDSGEKFSVVMKSVDNPWDVSLVKFFWMHVNASAPVNVREFEAARVRQFDDSLGFGVRDEVEAAFAKAQNNPHLIKELGAFLKSKGLFERYQDRFFQLVRMG